MWESKWQVNFVALILFNKEIFSENRIPLHSDGKHEWHWHIFQIWPQIGWENGWNEVQSELWIWFVSWLGQWVARKFCSLVLTAKFLINFTKMWVKVYHNAEGKEEFGEKPFLTMPKKGFCEFMQTSYKERLYEHIKDFSNLPHPEECPVKAVSNNLNTNFQ